MMLPRRYAPLGRLNVVCPYYTMFLLEFLYIALIPGPPRDWVFDPFCGRGTTLFAARLRGLGSVGVDSNPVAAAIAAAKFSDVNSATVVSLCDSAFRNPPASIEVPDGEFWKWCYHPATLLEICILRDFLLHDRSSRAKALRAILLGILHGPLTKGLPTYLSNQMPRTYSTKPDAAVEYWACRNMKPRRVNTFEAVSRRSAYIFQELPPRTSGRVIHGDIRTLELRWARQFAYVITSPPYLGMRCYVPDQWLRNWFLGLSDDVDYGESKQLSLSTRESFVRQLALVWKRVARVCRTNTRLIVRFGALPSMAEDPAELIFDSLKQSGAGWRVSTVQGVPEPPTHRRQSNQFFSTMKGSLREVDVYARLED